MLTPPDLFLQLPQHPEHEDDGQTDRKEKQHFEIGIGHGGGSKIASRGVRGMKTPAVPGGGILTSPAEIVERKD